MIGQNNLTDFVQRLVIDNRFPRFSIFVGPEGSGKKQLCTQIASYLGIVQNVCGIGVDDIRKVIAEAYKIALPIIYVIPDADKMSPAARNALLKITEDPPRSAYFIMTLTDLSNTIATIRSRGTVFYMDNYTADEIDEYYHNNHSSYTDERKIIGELCETPGEVDKLVDMGTVSFYEYVTSVVDNIAVVSGANSFKIANKLKFKETDTSKYDLRLFWKAFMFVCSSRLRNDPIRYANGVKITSKYLQEIRITGINKQSTFDCWLLDIRTAWM